MPDLLSTGVSGLLANHRRMDVTSHNVANANTPGYSRQRVEVSQQNPQYYGYGYVGNGVKIDTVARRYNHFLADRVRASESDKSRLTVYHDLTHSLDNVLADDSAGLSPALNDFYAALQDVSNNPTSIPVRQTLLSRAGILTRRFHRLEQHVDTSYKRVNDTVKRSVNDINTIAQAIAQLNRRIISAKGAAHDRLPNDLLDKRDHLVDELSQKVGVKAVLQGNGSYNVFIGNGQALVMGQHATKLKTVPSAYNARALGIAIGDTVVTDQLSGGSLGGALDARHQAIEPAQNALGRIAVGLAHSLNAQHHSGVDLSGHQGGDLFNVQMPDVRANIHNQGTANLSASVADVSALTGKNYILTKTDSGWKAVTAQGRQAVALSGSGSQNNPLVVDGVDVVVDGSANTGDRYLLRPTARAARSISVAISDPAKLAAAMSVRTTSAASNTGDAKISAATVTDADNPALDKNVTIQFTSPTHYTINGSGDYQYKPGQVIELNGWKVSLSGKPDVGDTFTVERNTGGVGDNRNVLAMAHLQDTGILSDGTTSAGEAYQQLVAEVGTQTRRAKANLDAATALHKNAKTAKKAASGVNLDEEAANLVRFQQAYRASARMIGASRKVFNSLMQSLG